ncbi:RNA polymerase sigma-70 factor [Desertivirga xinjiangensis]|uniref:RNA polymerase sigma-70 factor n=1 Tax=Desertivirga xinjiangensis TaxID=539206 RepID=UPI00210981F9|nr:RNA polymerase sigma-70 factor [Pedobacter xinjiangensis]
MTIDYAELSDQQLIQECSKDNMRAFNQLFERYFALLYSFSIKYVKDSAVAEELAMDLMHNIWKKRGSLEIKGNVDRYLFSAMKNVVFNHIRKNELITVSIDNLSEVPASAIPAPDHNLEYKELEKIYQSKVAQLSPQRKKIFKLSREENMTYPQIAKDMNLSINTIKTQMLVSLKFLRENMNDHIDVTISLLFFILF